MSEQSLNDEIKKINLQLIKLSIPNNLPIGIEIEFEPKKEVIELKQKIDKFKKSDIFGNHWKIDIQKDEHEIVSPQFYNQKNDLKILKNICTLLKQEKVAITDKTSCQYSFDLSIFENNPLLFQRFLKIWTLYESEIYAFSYGMQKNPRSCLYERAIPFGNILFNLIPKLPLTSLESNIQLFTCWLNQPKKFGFWLDYHPGLDKNRLEIRTPNGTTSFIIIINSFEFFYNLLTVGHKNIDWEQIDYRLANKKEIFIDPNYILNITTKSEFKNAYQLSKILYSNEVKQKQFLKQYLK